MAMVWYEIKKILLRPSCQIALLILLVLAGQSCYRVLYGSEGVSWTNELGQTETGYAAARKLRNAQREWSGTLDQELLEKALAELKRIDSAPDDPSLDEVTQSNIKFSQKQKLMPIRTLLNLSFKGGYEWQYGSYFVAEKVEPEQLPHFYENRIQHLKEWLYDEDSTGYTRFSETEKQYLIRNYETLETPFQVGYTAGWEQAFSASYYTILYGTILIAFLISGVFANEFRWKADSVYFSTELGRKEGSAAKLTAGFLFTTVVYWSVLLAVNLFILIFLGFDGGNCPVQATFHYWNSIHHITFFQLSLLQLADGYVLWMFISALVMLVAAASRSVSISVCVPSVLIMVPDMLERKVDFEKALSLLTLFPHRMTSIYANRTLILYTILGNVVTPAFIQRVLFSSLTILMFAVCYRVYRRKQIR